MPASPLPRKLFSILAIAVAAAALEARAQTTDGGSVSPEDEKLLEEIQAAAAQPPKSVTLEPAAPTARAPTQSSGAMSNVFNPALSLNGLFLGSAAFPQDPGPDYTATGVSVQELELQLLSNVDPYLTANVTLAIPGGESLEVEEGILELLPQPLGIRLRAGKLKAPFGRENVLHTHALPFVDRSLVGNAIFGEEGLNEVGVEGSYLAPLPWYTLLTVAGMDGRNEGLYASPRGRDFAGLGALKNVFDLTDDATLEAGAHYTLGNNAELRLAQAAGAHLVFKWKPAAASTTSSAVLSVEGMHAWRPSAAVAEVPQPERTFGLSTYGQWQLARRWYTGGRFEYLTFPSLRGERTFRESLILIFAPTEFSAIRAQGSVTEPPWTSTPVFEAFLQLNFTIGAHRAHSY